MDMGSSEDHALASPPLSDGTIRGTISVVELNRDVNTLASNINVSVKVYSCVDGKISTLVFLVTQTGESQ